MPWCPKCKMEYQEGFTQCSDCKSELVDSLEEEMVSLLQSADQAMLEKLISFYEYSGLKAKLEFNQILEVYEVRVPEKKQKQAKKLYQAFTVVESERILKENAAEKAAELSANFNEDTLEIEATDEVTPEVEATLDAQNETEAEDEDDLEEIIINKGQNVYVMKADQYKDLRDTVLVFSLFGIAGMLAVILNVAGVFNFMSTLMMQGVFTVIFLFFLYVAFSTQKKAAKVKAEIEVENQLTKKINDWLELHVTDRFLAELHDGNLSDEINYIKKTDHIKEMLAQEFGEQNPAYLDRLIDEFYSSHFDD